METAKRKKFSISQKLIAQYKVMREARLVVETELRNRQKEEDRIKAKIMEALKADEEIEPGTYQVKIKYLGKWPDWKSEFAKKLGEDEVEAVIANTPFREGLEIVENGE